VTAALPAAVECAYGPPPRYPWRGGGPDAREDKDMTTIAEPAFAAQLGISVTWLWRLRRNPAFPVPSVIDPAGQASQWNTTASAPFVALWTSLISKGWRVSYADLPVAPIAFMAANSPGQYYQPPLVDELFDLP
jgi:predicted DNA-binding transcriptional regulator AlpA